MKTSNLFSQDRAKRSGWLFLTLVVGILLLCGLFLADSLESLVPYAMVTIVAILPSALWLRVGTPGIPVWPAVAALHYLYFALPIVRQNVVRASYDLSDFLAAATTVTLFLAAATVTWWLVLGISIRQARTVAAYSIPARQIVQFTFCGIALCLLFNLALISGWLDVLGSVFGLVRTVALTAASISCFMLGYCRARGYLHGTKWRLALIGMTLMIALSWASLFLVQGMTYVLAALLGYVITARRVPWKVLVPTAVVLFVLHAGKAEIRERYWAPGYEAGIPIGQVPGIITEWFANGISAIGSGNVSQDIIDRASLLNILLDVRRQTPQYIPYLGGETYALLPAYLVPRFWDPDKISTQAGLALLNIRYGNQTAESNKYTTIGWGVISEAFANFGDAGVVGIGLIFGVLTGFFTRISTGVSPMSASSLLSVAAMMIFINLEADLAFLLTNLWQALIAAAMFLWPLQLMAGRDRKLSGSGDLKSSRPLHPT